MLDSPTIEPVRHRRTEFVHLRPTSALIRLVDKAEFDCFTSWAIIKSSHLKVWICIWMPGIANPNPTRVSSNIVQMVVIDNVNILHAIN